MGFLIEGKKTEKQFMLDYKLVYPDSIITESSTEDDINKHFDLVINNYRYDIKGLKKISRNDLEFNEHYHWIELLNVNGKLGSLYGEADYFVFETMEFWIIVDSIKLRELVKTKTNKIIVEDSDMSLYCLYKRNSRKDCLTLVKTLDLMLINTEIIHKTTKIETDYGFSIHQQKKLQQKLKKHKN